MPDISMCPGEMCTQRDKCYRYKAKPSQFRQSFFMKAPWTIYEGRQVCTYLWPMEEEKNNEQASTGLRSDSL